MANIATPFCFIVLVFGKALDTSARLCTCLRPYFGEIANTCFQVSSALFGGIAVGGVFIERLVYHPCSVQMIRDVFPCTLYSLDRSAILVIMPGVYWRTI